jgi:hypothetical protein
VGSGLPVPHARAHAVIDAARSVAAQHWPADVAQLPAAVRGRVGEARFTELCLLADTSVVAEHPSADSWTADERRDVAEWVAVLVDGVGEDGVRQLVCALLDGM